MRSYRLSKYNQFYVKKDAVVGVNLHKQYLFSLDREKFDLLKENQSNLNVLKENSPILFNAMYKLGIIEDSEIDIPNILIMRNRQEVFSEDSFRLIINPTLNCNFSCWYCYETHSKKYMSKETVDSLIKLIEYLATKNKISRLHIDWFGGEPLLCFESVIRPVSIETKKICNEHNINFFMTMTTNGYFIRDHMLPFFKEHNMRGFQITLDGNREKHNLTRYYGKNKKGSFDTIVNNICLLATKIRITLRINYTKGSLDDCTQIIDQFPKEVRSNISLALVQVWQDRSLNNETDRTILNKKEVDIYKKFREAGFRVSLIRYSCGINCSCYADLKNEAIVNYDGRVFKCTTANFEVDKEDGILTPEGEIIWEEDRIAKRLSKATFDNEICIKCEYLPICHGSCSTNPIVKTMPNKICNHKPRLKKSVREAMVHFEKKKYKIGHLNTIKEELELSV